MNKLFFEVFPTLKIAPELGNQMREVEVARVSNNRDKGLLRIYLSSARLMQKADILQLECAIKEQLFAHCPMTVKIIEKYCLSGQYTARKLFDVYRDSLMLEMKEHSLIDYNLLRCARMEFLEESHLKLTLTDTIMAAKRSDEIVHFLEKAVCERCGLDLIVQVEYQEEKEGKHRRESDLRIASEVQSILARAGRAEGAQGGESALAGTGGGYEAGAAGDVGYGAEAAGDVGYGAGAAGDVGYGAEAARDAGYGSGAAGGASGKGGFGRRGGGRTYVRNNGDSLKKSDNPDVAYGRDFNDEPMEIEQILEEMGEVTVRGRVLSVDVREIRNERSIVIFAVTDFTDTIVVKMFVKSELAPELTAVVKKGAFLKVKGVTTVDRYDGELTIGSVYGIKKIADFTTARVDSSPVKRVELHCHTKMSDMDGVSDVKELIQQAMDFGMPALAITDHGNVQSFPDASHAVPKGSDFKVIYGVEGYLVDDLRDIVVDSKNQPLEDAYVVFDLETTGFSPLKDRIIEIGAVRVEQGKVVSRFSTFVNPEVPIPFEIEELTGIRDDMVLESPRIEDILPDFLTFCQGAALVAHNAGFDMSFVRSNCERQKLPCAFTVVDTVSLSRTLLPGLSRYKLDAVAKELKVFLGSHHRAVDDASCTAEVFIKLMGMLKERGIDRLDQVNELGKSSKEGVKKLPSHHVILLATNDLGRTNLYRLVSASHLSYFHRQPRIPKSELMKHREGLLVGSACEAGEVFQALLRGSAPEELARLAQFYDYLEIQPLCNNAFMLRGEKPAVSSEEELRDLNRRVVALGEEFHKPVVATCDVHFRNPEDEIYRRIIMSYKRFKDADDQAPLYLRTTEEMLAEFAYLGSEKAREVVIENTNKIAAMCERIEPVRPDKRPPVIEDSDKELRRICYSRAHELYGEQLPEVVVNRLERELTSIISNGFAVMYIIAQKLVWKSNEDGYLVGSRGSVGSSFVATMAGITEVNPLSPHYYCDKCHYSDFDSPEVREYAGRVGCDLPERACPVCGEMLKKDGYDIPFETFLGFKGNKEPDIDLNFSGEYQSRAHKYTEVIFGEGQTFRAGTIGTVAEAMAFGYVKKYYEEHEEHKRSCEIARIVEGCVGVRRTTGQHPGGIIVLPIGEEIHSFTPLQHPANDTETDIITTHFDYHSIDHNLLKLDILGHDDPTMIRKLEDLTGVDVKSIPLDNPEVLSLFQGTKALGIEPEDIGGCSTGSLGIPEFGTDFVIQMLEDTKPCSVSDLVRISGLSHGTNVWVGNAKTLIQEGKATLSNAICTRDDIMTYLIGMGLDSEESFKIMEAVRKGAVAKGKCGDWPAWEKDMLSHGVPDWYVWSCTQIQYMFPKAHAAAYVMMALRIGYFKVFYPLAYYAAFFSIRATSFNYELMCQGKERLLHFIADYIRRKNELSKKEQETMKVMKIVQEMYARGFEFIPLDVYRAKARDFQIIDGKLMPSLSSIEGMGDKAAEGVEAAAGKGKFLSRDDFKERTGVTGTVTELMVELGILKGLPKSNQLSLFDLS